MKKLLLLIFILAMVTSACQLPPLQPLPPLPASCEKSTTVKIASLEYETVLVRVKAIDEALKLLIEAEILPKYISDLNVFEIDKQFAEIVKSVLGEEIIFVQPNYKINIFTSDPLWDKQWNFRDTEGGANIENMWKLEPNPAQGITVAVIDTGVDYKHKDIAECILPGKDFIDNDDNPMDKHGHGTHVSGTIAEKTNNELGAAGITEACILPVRVLNENGSGDLVGVASGIRWACGNGAKVINLSLGVNQDCTGAQTLQEAVDFCVSQDVVVVAAAGNDNSSSPGSPASCNGVISVTATQVNGERAPYSNCGEWTSIAAPGGDGEARVWQNVLSPDYDGYRGTSMAAPHVAALSAIALSKGVKPENVLSKLCEFSRPVITENTGCGIVDGYKLIKGISP